MDDEGPISVDDATSILRRALLAIAVGDVGAIDLFTEDVVGDGPNLRVHSRSELGHQLLDRAGALSNVDFRLGDVEVVGPTTAVVSWRIAGDHTGELMLNEDLFFDPSGRRIDVTVTSHVVFRGRRVAEFRTFYDGEDLIDQIRGDPPPPDRR